MEDNLNLLAPASPELGTAQPQLVFAIFLFLMQMVALIDERNTVYGSINGWLDPSEINTTLRPVLQAETSTTMKFQDVPSVAMKFL